MWLFVHGLVLCCLLPILVYEILLTVVRGLVRSLGKKVRSFATRLIRATGRLGSRFPILDDP